MPHKVCLFYDPALIWINVVTDALFVVAFVILIPVALHIYIRSSGVSVPRGYRWMVHGFELFIGLCGLVHLMAAVTLWIPAYWIEAMVKIPGAIVSFVVAILLVKTAPYWTLHHWQEAMRIVRERDA